jgi:hypothetical protein
LLLRFSKVASTAREVVLEPCSPREEDVLTLEKIMFGDAPCRRI